ncbi:hypothetical protein [Pseudonocardia lacus]|jgi:hypothetical protein|uniref:hypothetical protein n=1 Tax=Pseudonocardia lacus TaxID=2835865 RepID=UPI001BDD3292|nr:hypothetical protein [Pseudonocardia lacus]
MLKKAGIIASVVAAGVLGVSAVAFADVTNTETGNVTNDCTATQEGPAIAQDLTGGSSVLGAAGLVTGAVAPVTTQTQAANCTNVNVSDVLDSESGNVDESFTRTEVEDSYNESFSG